MYILREGELIFDKQRKKQLEIAITIDDNDINSSVTADREYT